MFKKIIIIILCVLIIACQEHDKNTLKVGTIAGPETDLLQTAKAVAKKQFGLNIEIIEFTDYSQPNAALNDGSIDANVFQHQPFLDQEIHDKGYALISIGKTFIYPMGIYSTKVKAISALRNGAIVAIPNDVTNEARALLLLQKANLIKLNNKAGIYATLQDIVENPRQLQIKELDSAQIVRSLPDVDIGIINTNFALPAGLSPKKDAIFLESKHSPYANIIVIRQNAKDDPRMKQLVASFQSQAVLKMADKIFKNEAIAAW